jgi:hypothetical protein
MREIIEEGPPRADSGANASAEKNVREQAIKQIERRRRFWVTTAISTVGLLIVAVIWAVSEYHNAGGWPTNGFSQSSGIHDVWNIWIIYPAIAWAFLTAASALAVFLRRPISDSQITHEIEREAHSRH